MRHKVLSIVGVCGGCGWGHQQSGEQFLSRKQDCLGASGLPNFVMVHHDELGYFTTATCLEWKPLLAEDRFKQIVVESMRFLVEQGWASIHAFVIMPNHMHLVWRFLGGNQREAVQRNFLKYTAQRMLQILRNSKSPLLQELEVYSRDRKHQVWERDSLSVPLWTTQVWAQKIGYIHWNPVKAGLCSKPEEYRYSSARHYSTAPEWDFLTLYKPAVQ